VVFFWSLTRHHSLFRYFRLWVNLASNWTYTPIQPVDDPTITSKDVTVIIPTVAEDLQQLKETVQSAYRLEPFELLLVTPDSRVKRVYQMVEELGCPKTIQVLSVSQANKRRQLCRAIPEVETKITLLLDDDVWLPEKFNKWLLAPFEDPRMGGVGTNQQLRRVNRSNIWEFLGAMYLVRRNFDCTACNWIDGGLPCLSGRAVAYRSEILQDPNFTYGFTHETWGSDHFLNADDDNFITRWLFTHNWKIQIQNHRECEVETTLESDSKYLRQCLRWVRSNWRSNLTSLADISMWMYVLNASCNADACIFFASLGAKHLPLPPHRADDSLTHCITETTHGHSTPSSRPPLRNGRSSSIASYSLHFTSHYRKQDTMQREVRCSPRPSNGSARCSGVCSWRTSSSQRRLS
jgi:cellulose synthase/poly-beta-1,6-N-acetylglucosamine synthase-like glycosyltransferase